MFQDIQVVGNGWLGHLEMPADLRHAHLLLSQEGQYLLPGRIGQSLKYKSTTVIHHSPYT